MLPALLVLLLAGGAACTQPPPAPMRLGTVMWPGHEPLFLARESGQLPDAQVRLVEYSSLSEVNRAFRNGALDAAGLTLDMALALAQQGFEPRVVLVMDISQGADALLARPEVAQVRALRGRRVGVEESGVSGYVLGRALERAGLAASDVQVVWTPVEQQVRAYREGALDAVVSFEPVVGQLMAAGARRLFDSSELPGEVQDVLVVRRAYLDAHPAEVAALLDAWFAAADTVQARPQAASLELSPRLGMSAEEFRRVCTQLHFPSREENLALLGGERPGIVPIARRMYEVLLRLGLVRGAWPEAPLADARALQGGAPRQVAAAGPGAPWGR
ncbi:MULTISPECIES: ABC transporter substrate-binding protein [Myxococcaceae]|uniref:ABC transporter substrate-binding protein n=1 Tax=Myxococcaceae TaxID=31 RepID=UPI00188EF495|nr:MULTISPECIES: ABC transporter substrate-binding protein [Myxococcaceae]MBF5046604.1 ABC transporter substrate-binding protein [Simulacricoccus sp. 17bor-14]